MTSMEVSEFEALRQHLMSVAYRLTGTVADAEDIVQEAWLRWDSQDTVIADPRAWLTTVVSRLGLDKLRSAAHRRETYTGTWLPEPVVTGLDATDPLAAVVAAEDARFAAMVVLERLRPDQRVAFVLHDGFAVPFAEVAEVLGTSEADQGRIRAAVEAVFDAHPALGTVFEPRVDTLTSRPGGGGWGWGVEPPGAAVAEVIARHSASFDMYTGRLFAVSLLPGSPDRLVLTASRLCVDDASWQTVVEDLVRQYDESVLVPAR